MKEMQRKIKKFVQENNLEIKPEFRALDMVSETGELSREILKATEFGNKEFGFNEEIRHEMGELLFSLVCLANTYNIDLDQAINEVLQKYKKKINENEKF